MHQSSNAIAVDETPWGCNRMVLLLILLLTWKIRGGCAWVPQTISMMQCVANCISNARCEFDAHSKSNPMTSSLGERGSPS